MTIAWANCRLFQIFFFKQLLLHMPACATCVTTSAVCSLVLEYFLSFFFCNLQGTKGRAATWGTPPWCRSWHVQAGPPRTWCRGLRCDSSRGTRSCASSLRYRKSPNTEVRGKQNRLWSTLHVPSKGTTGAKHTGYLCKYATSSRCITRDMVRLEFKTILECILLQQVTHEVTISEWPL